jgi:small subunit ribosomal protein S8
MSVADPIADMLTRIRNAVQAKKTSVTMPGSNLKRDMLNRMCEEGYLTDVSFEADGKQGLLTAVLKYDDNGESVVDGVKRI